VNDLTLIREIEEVAADAVPAAVVEHLGGWRLRFNHGVKRRPNSVLANAEDGTLALEEKLERVEAFYARHGLGARYQLCPASEPANLVDTLLKRGYTRVPEAVSVQTRALADWPSSEDARVTLLDTPSETWLSLYCEIENLTGKKREAFGAMVTRFPGISRFALARGADGQGAAVGVGVLHGGFLGLFNIATHPSARRQGLGTRVVSSLLGWAQAEGAPHSYLQVAGENSSAKAMYERLGFRTLYAYFYLEKPL
jgi:GNAT superfamily N-acetyltransferase